MLTSHLAAQQPVPRDQTWSARPMPPGSPAPPTDADLALAQDRRRAAGRACAGRRFQAGKPVRAASLACCA